MRKAPFHFQSISCHCCRNINNRYIMKKYTNQYERILCEKDYTSRFHCLLFLTIFHQTGLLQYIGLCLVKTIRKYHPTKDALSYHIAFRRYYLNLVRYGIIACFYQSCRCRSDIVPPRCYHKCLLLILYCFLMKDTDSVMYCQIVLD